MFRMFLRIRSFFKNRTCFRFGCILQFRIPPQNSRRHKTAVECVLGLRIFIRFFVSSDSEKHPKLLTLFGPGFAEYPSAELIVLDQDVGKLHGPSLRPGPLVHAVCLAYKSISKGSALHTQLEKKATSSSQQNER